MIIYKATNLINGKVYIGQTVRPLEKRIRKHYEYSKTHTYHFAQALNKYKKEDWKWEIIDTAENIEDLNIKEEYWIKIYDSTITGYNIKPGGNNCKHSEETKKKIGDHFRGKPLSQEHIEKMRLSRLGTKQSEETKLKRSKSLMGNKNSLGNKLSEYTKQKIGMAFRKKVLHIETGVVYEGTRDAASKTGSTTGTVSQHCNNKVKKPRYKYVE